MTAYRQPVTVTDRLERVEALQAIGLLPSRYAMAIDARDLDSLVATFVDDVDAGSLGTGREALRAWYDGVLRRFYRSIHLIGGHVVDLVDADHAVGSTYCRAEHEDGDGWFVVAMRYEDTYERRDNRWYFTRRHEHPWYAVDVTERPGPEFLRWPPGARYPDAMPHRMPSWQTFWERGDTAQPQRLSRTP
jgi:ketosteroid isomerase-like protein